MAAWSHRAADAGLARRIAAALGVSEPLAAVLSRSFTDEAEAERHLRPQLAHVSDPFAVGGLREAAREGDVRIDATVSLAEIAGSDTFVHVHSPVGELVAQLAGVHNLGLGDGHELTLAGLMLFGRNPLRWRPAFTIKAVAFGGSRP